MKVTVTQETSWKPIKGYENCYAISNTGQVKSLKRIMIYGRNHKSSRILPEKILRQTADKDGYYCVSLHKDGKKQTLKIHRLVAEHFIFNPDSFKEVNHKDENKSNNSANNLEWCNGLYNLSYGTGRLRSIASQHRKAIIGTSLINGNTIKYGSVNDIKREGIFSSTAICMCCKNKYYSKKNIYKNYIWKYAD